MIIRLPLDPKLAWFTDLDGVSLSLIGEWPLPTSTPGVDASVRDYAGRRRTIRSARKSSTTQFSVVMVTEAQRLQMEAWMGKTLLLRTIRWRRWGMYSELPTTELGGTEDVWEPLYRLDIAWTDTDVDESV